ncbi:hypothetical protein NQ317_003430 [Molorchus minor]|uniref:Sulfotransferase domain-containing protein n=1 Tax=Molorchus minor TaxID=1323400 RepID=A0ABQ9JHA0_9CUCU|nr:hypothetical protein NQ317_003430 [Molorchus minor]
MIKTKIPRIFVVTDVGNMLELFRKYLSLRPPHVKHKRLFLYYKAGKCSSQPVGKNTMGKIPSVVASYLKLPDVACYTGHCLRRSSATLLADAGVDITTIKRHAGWKSTTVAEEEFRNSVRVITEQMILNAPKYYPDYAETIYNFKVRPDDVWVITFPKSGTTLTQEMVWLIANGEKRLTCLIGKNFETAKRTLLRSRNGMDSLDIRRPQWEVLDETPNRRFIKSHLPFPLLPPSLLTSGCKNNYGPYWEHVKLGWNARSNKNVCFMFYEDMVKVQVKPLLPRLLSDKSTPQKWHNFWRDLTEEQVDKLADHLNVDNMRKYESVTNTFVEYLNDECRFGPLVREGKSGGWRNWFNDEVNEKANKWIEDNRLIP